MRTKKQNRQRAALLPRKLRDIYETTHGEEFVEQLERVTGPRHPKPAYLRMNLLKTTEDAIRESLSRHGIVIETIPHVKNAWKVIRGQKTVKSIPEYFAGWYHVQDVTSILAVEVLELQLDHAFLDACAAPGGKTSHAAQVMQNSGVIVANEVSFERVQQLMAVINRLGVQNVMVLNQDATMFDFSKLGQFDRLLVDAPCTSDGVAWRRGSWKPILRHYNELDKLVTRQWLMIDNCWKAIKEGGIMLYATCSFSFDENELLITRFLQEHEDAQLMDLSRLPLGEPAWYKHEGVDSELRKARRFTPMKDGTNGFFMAKIEKS